MNRALRDSIAVQPSRPDLSTVAAHTGIVIRYAFYLFGAVVFGLIGLGIMLAWGSRTKLVTQPPAFQLASSQLARLPVTSQVVTGGRFGRAEILQYGQLYDRDVDLTVAMIMPPQGVPMVREFGQQLRDIRPMRNARAVFTSNYHDLQTRFGPVRAADLRVDSDGQWKQCLAFLTRFDTLAVYFTGWYCDASGAKPSPDRLACMLDKLTLDKELASKEADAFLRERSARSPSCSATPVSQTIDTRTYRTPQSPQKWSTPSAQRRY